MGIFYSVKILQVYVIPFVRQCYGKCVVSKEITWTYFYSIKILQVYVIPFVCPCYGKCGK